VAAGASRWGVDELVPALAGVVDVEHGRSPGRGEAKDDWVSPWRLPFADLELHHLALLLPAMCPTGGRIRLLTASRRLLLEGEPLAPTGLPDFAAECELVSGGAVAATALIGPRGAEFSVLPPGEKLVELWLPTMSAVRLRGLRALDGEALLPAPPDERPRWTVYGSSITHGFATAPTRTWPAVAARLLGRNVTNLGYSGACLLDPLVARMIAERTVDHITLEIGTNVHNTAGLRERTLAPVLHGFLAMIRAIQPRVPITLVGPIFGGEREESTVASRRGADGTGADIDGDLTLVQLRAVLQGVVEVLRRRGDTALTWIDGLSLLGVDDAAAGRLPDGLHPDAAGHELLGRRYAAAEQAAETILTTVPANTCASAVSAPSTAPARAASRSNSRH
jgi:hypothetical protein